MTQTEATGLATGLRSTIGAADFLRRSPYRLGGLGYHKEWLHFVIHTAEVDILVNFSLVDDNRSAASGRLEQARLVVLTHDGTWRGDIELFDPSDVSVMGGDIHLQYGANRVEFRDGCYHVEVCLRDRPISMKLELRPLTMPAISNNIRLELDDRPINWMVMPRLQASGRASIGGRSYRFVNAPAYHDHNWGHFLWGRNFTWEWGFSLPESPEVPWSLVFVRLMDRGRRRALMQGLFLWKAALEHRVFRATDVRVAPHGTLDLPRIFKLPGVMNVISPGTAVDIPERLEVEGREKGDWLRFVFHAADAAAVCIPNDTDDHAVTAIHEVTGELELKGSIYGESVSLQGAGMFEFVRSG